MEEMCSHSHWFCVWGQFYGGGGGDLNKSVFKSSKVWYYWNEVEAEIAWCIIQNVRGSGLQGTFFCDESI